MREELELASKLLENACRALEGEIRRFASKESMTTLRTFENDQDLGDPIKNLLDRGHEPEPWREFATALQMVQKEVQERADVDALVRDQVKEEERLLSTVGRLVDAFAEEIEEARVSPPTLEALAQQADLLRNFTEMWTIYQIAWEQRHEESQDPSFTLRSLRAADRVVRNLYEAVQDKGLDLRMRHPQLLIVVPFMSSLYAAGFDAPTPYIVGPYWGHRQVWTWLGYAHEVGHHVYRNVKGLSNELKVNVAMELWSRGEGYDLQYIWFHWLEEIFADLFGLLQIGPALARTQQLMLPHLPFRVLRRMAEGSDLRDALLRAADETHPIPHLRVFLATQALEKLDTPEADTKLLIEKWDTFFQGVDTSKVYARIRGHSRELPTDKMEKVGDTVLDVILNTDLYALAKTSSPTKPRNLRDVFSESLDEREKGIEDARKAITNGVPSGDFEMRHLLAATQESLEELWKRMEGKPSDEDIDALNTRVVNVIVEAYQEPALPAI